MSFLLLSASHRRFDNVAALLINYVSDDLHCQSLRLVVGAGKMGEIKNATGNTEAPAPGACRPVRSLARSGRALEVRRQSADLRVSREGDRTDKPQAASSRLQTTRCALAVIEPLDAVAALEPPAALAGRVADRDRNAAEEAVQRRSNAKPPLAAI